MRLLLVILLLISFTLASSGQETNSSENPTSLRAALRKIEAEYGVVFSFKDLNIKEQKIILPQESTSLEELIDRMFSQTELEARFITERHIIITTRSDYGDQEEIICGKLVDFETGEALPYATIQIAGTEMGSYTNESGEFQIKRQTEKDTIILSYLGYEQKRLASNDLMQSPCKQIPMHTARISLAPVLVKEYLTDGIKQSKTDPAIVINPQRLSSLPGAVEPDVMTSIQMLPGIFSPDETASNIYIRGGTPDQNLILYDGIPVYHTGHFFGMISAFNPYIIEAVDVYRSGIGTQYGGRVSGVIDIQSEKELPEKWNGGVGLNMTHGHFFTSTPLWKNSGLSFSVRRSITDSWATPTFLSYAEKVFQGTKLEDGDFQDESVSVNDKFWFSDANVKWQWNPGSNKFGLNVFGAENSLDYSTEIPQWNAFSLDVLKLNSEGFRAYWDREWSSKFSSKFSITSSRFDYDYNLSYRRNTDVDIPILEFSSINNITDDGIKLHNEWAVSDKQKMSFGYQYTENLIEIKLEQRGNAQVIGESQNFENRLHALFGQYELNMQEILHLSFGLRFQRQTVLDNDYFEPRISAKIQLSDPLKLSISTSKQFQFVSQLVLLNINDIGISNQIWIASDGEGIPVIESNQWAAGLQYVKNDWTLEVEGYVKELDGITSRSNSFGNIPGQPFSQGKARIRGIDVLLKKRFENYRSWLSYTLSSALYEFPALEEDAFPASHDQRHAIQWVHIYESGPWEFSLGWQLRSGLPATEATGIDYFENQMGNMVPYIVYGPTNAERLKAYHRLDASVMYHFGKADSFSGFFGMSLFNIYNRSNLTGRQYLLDNENPPMDQVEILEINKGGLKFTPNFVVNISW